MIKIKKLLTSLAAIGLVASTSSMVVSCGPSFNKLENRKIDSSVYKTTFNHSIQNWNMAATMQSADYKILANLQDSLMSFNKAGEEGLTSKIASVVKDKDKSDNTKITLEVSPNAKWFKITDGSVVRNITANDIANTARYTLDPQNASEEVGDWKTLVKGAADTFNEISDAEKNKTGEALQKAKDDAFNKLISVSDQTKPIYVNGNQITITFAKPNNYFETVLAGGSFAPTPDEALSMGYAYGRSDYKNVLISGPYYLAEYKPSYMMKFKRNPNYKLGDVNSEGTIDTIEYLYSLNSDDASQRRLWEVGDITEAKLTPSDVYGEKHYKDWKGVSKIDNNLVGLKYLDFNFSKHPDIDKDPTQEDKDSNYALSLSSVRTLIAFAMNRATLIKYFSGKDNVNDFITNTYNPFGFLKDGDKDYANEIQDDANIGDLQARDAYYQNLKLLDSEHVNDLQGLIDNINNELKGHVSKKPKLSFLTSGANKNTFNPYIKKMIQDFNGIKNNPIEIVEKPTADDAEYQLTQTKGDFSMFITGSSPSYLDPMSELIDLKINGKMSAYNGLNRLFDSKGNTQDQFSKFNVSDEFKTSIEDINTKIEAADNDATASRFSNFAQAESDILYTYKNVIPLYKPDGKEISYLSYVDNSTRPNVGYGYNDYRLDNVKLYKTLKDYIKNKQDVNQEVLTKQN